MGIKKHVTVPLVMPYEERTTKGGTTSGMINAGMQETATKAMEIVRRPGLALKASRAAVTAVAPGLIKHALGTATPTYMVVYDGTWRVVRYDGTGTLVLHGSLLAGNGFSERIYWSDVTRGSNRAVIFGNAWIGQWYIENAGAPVQITDPDAVPFVRGFAFMDGYTIAASNTYIANSGLNAPEVWSALDVIRPSSSTFVHYADIHSKHVVVFGNSSIEFFYNAGNPTGSILANRRDVRNETVGLIYPPGEVGIIKGSTPVVRLQDDDAYVFIGKTIEERRGLYILKDMLVTKISDTTIDNYLMSREIITSYNENPFHVATTSSDGRVLVHLYIVYGTAPVAFTYSHHVLDLESGIWSTWETSNSWDPAGVPIMLATGQIAYGNNGSVNRQIFQNSTGLVGEIMENSSQFQDTLISGAAFDIPVTIQTPKFSGDDGDKHKPKSLNRLQVRGAQKNGLTVAVSWSNNDYVSYNTPRSVAVENDRALRQCGRFFDRSFKITNSENVELRLSALELTYEVDN